MATFRIDQASPGAGTAGLSRHDLVPGEIITLTAITPAGPGVTYTWEIIDKVGSNAVLSDTTGTVVTIGPGAAITQPCAFLIRLTVDDNGTLTTEERIASLVTVNLGIRIPLFTETAPTTNRLDANDPSRSTDNAIYPNRAGLGAAEQNWRGWAEWAWVITTYVDSVVSGGTLPTGPAGGDLALTYPNPRVAGLYGIALGAAAATPGLGQALVYNGSEYVPTTTGDVVGPAMAVDNAISRFDGTSGKLIASSLASINDSGVITAPEITLGESGGALLGGMQTIWERGGAEVFSAIAGAGRLFTRDVGGNSHLYYLPGGSTTPILITVGNEVAVPADVIREGDPRLSDDRTPTAHAVTHASGGSDEIEHDTLAGLGDDDHLQYLPVTGARPMTGQLLLSSGTLANPGWGFDGDPNTGARRTAADTMAFVTGGVDRAVISDALITTTLPIQVTGASGGQVTIGQSPGEGAARGVLSIWKTGVGGEPTGFAGVGRLYTMDVAGVTQLFYLDGGGTAHQITPEPASVLDHGALTGLADDDHVQYLLINGTRAMTGTLRPNAHGTLDLGLDHETTPMWWRAAYVQTVEANNVNTSNLDVGTFASINRAQFAAGSVASPAITFWDSGFYAPVTGELRFESEGSDVLALSPNGGSLTGNWLPSVDLIYNLGHPSFRWGQIHAGEITVDSITTTTPIDHGSLGGLADDDHTQYLLIDGTRAMTGNLLTTGGTSVSLPGLSIGEATTGFWLSAANTLNLVVNGFTAIRATAAGVSFFYNGIAYPTFGSASMYIATGNYIIANQGVNTGLTIGGRRDTAASTLPSVKLLQYASQPFIGANINQAHVVVEAAVNQTGTSSFAAMQFDLTNTALGSGNQYFIEFKTAGTTRAAITNGATGGTLGRFQAGTGAAATPSLSFLANPDSGFYNISGNIGVTIAGSERWRFESNLLELRQTSMTITQGVAGGTLNIQGWKTTASGAGLTLSNRATFTATTAVHQNTVRVISVIDHTGVAVAGRGHSGLEIDSTNTTLDTGGAYYLADFKVGGTRVAGITNGSTAATQGNLLVGDGAAATPSMAFATTPNMGFYRSSGSIGLSFAGALRWLMSNTGISTAVNGFNFTIGHIGSTSRLTLTGRQDGTTSASANPSILLAQHSSLPFIGASQPQNMVTIQSIVNQTGTSSFTALDITTTETALGSGAQYLINAKAGAAGTTQMFAVTNTGRVLAGAGAEATPGFSFVGAPGDGMLSAVAGVIGFSTLGSLRMYLNTTEMQVYQRIIPDADAARDLGSSGRRWKDTYSSVFVAGTGSATSPSMTFQGFTSDGFYSRSAGHIGATAHFVPKADFTLDLGTSGLRWRTIRSSVINTTDITASNIAIDPGGVVSGWPYTTVAFHGRSMLFDNASEEYWIDVGGHFYTNSDVAYAVTRDSRVYAVSVNIYVNTLDDAAELRLTVDGSYYAAAVIPAGVTGVIDMSSDFDGADITFGSVFCWACTGLEKLPGGTLSLTVTHQLRAQ